MDERETTSSTAERDAATESAVLQLVLALHPAPITFEDLARELDADADTMARDALERAIRDLDRAGLLHRRSGIVLPTRAALRFDELMER